MEYGRFYRIEESIKDLQTKMDDHARIISRLETEETRSQPSVPAHHSPALPPEGNGAPTMGQTASRSPPVAPPAPPADHQPPACRLPSFHLRGPWMLCNFSNHNGVETLVLSNNGLYGPTEPDAPSGDQAPQAGGRRWHIAIGGTSYIQAELQRDQTDVPESTEIGKQTSRPQTNQHTAQTPNQPRQVIPSVSSFRGGFWAGYDKPPRQDLPGRWEFRTFGGDGSSEEQAQRNLGGQGYFDPDPRYVTAENVHELRNRLGRDGDTHDIDLVWVADRDRHRSRHHTHDCHNRHRMDEGGDATAQQGPPNTDPTGPNPLPQADNTGTPGHNGAGLQPGSRLPENIQDQTQIEQQLAAELQPGDQPPENEAGQEPEVGVSFEMMMRLRHLLRSTTVDLGMPSMFLPGDHVTFRGRYNLGYDAPRPGWPGRWEFYTLGGPGSGSDEQCARDRFSGAGVFEDDDHPTGNELHNYRQYWERRGAIGPNNPTSMIRLVWVPDEEYVRNLGRSNSQAESQIENENGNESGNETVDEPGGPAQPHTSNGVGGTIGEATDQTGNITSSQIRGQGGNGQHQPGDASAIQGSQEPEADVPDAFEEAGIDDAQNDNHEGPEEDQAPPQHDDLAEQPSASDQPRPSLSGRAILGPNDHTRLAPNSIQHPDFEDRLDQRERTWRYERRGQPFRLSFQGDIQRGAEMGREPDFTGPRRSSRHASIAAQENLAQQMGSARKRSRTQSVAPDQEDPGSTKGKKRRKKNEQAASKTPDALDEPLDESTLTASAPLGRAVGFQPLRSKSSAKVVPRGSLRLGRRGGRGSNKQPLQNVEEEKSENDGEGENAENDEGQ